MIRHCAGTRRHTLDFFFFLPVKLFWCTTCQTVVTDATLPTDLGQSIRFGFYTFKGLISKLLLSILSIRFSLSNRGCSSSRHTSPPVSLLFHTLTPVPLYDLPKTFIFTFSTFRIKKREQRFNLWPWRGPKKLLGRALVAGLKIITNSCSYNLLKALACFSHRLWTQQK